MDNLRCLRSPCLLDFLSGKLSVDTRVPFLGITYLSNHLGLESSAECHSRSTNANIM